MPRFGNKNDNSLEAKVRPGSLEVTGQQPELYPFDAFEFQTYDGKKGRPKLTMKDNWKLDPETIETYSLSVAKITAPFETTHIDGGDPEDSDEDTYDGGSHPKTDDDEIYNDNTGENDVSGMSKDIIAIESPVFFKEGIAGDMQSLNFESGESGWEITKDGDVEFNDGVFRGSLDAAGGTFKGNLDAAGGTFSGTLEASDGYFKDNFVIKTSYIEENYGVRISSVYADSAFGFRVTEGDLYDHIQEVAHDDNTGNYGKFSVMGFIFIKDTYYPLSYIIRGTGEYRVYDINGNKRTTITKDSSSIWSESDYGSTLFIVFAGLQYL